MAEPPSAQSSLSASQMPPPPLRLPEQRPLPHAPLLSLLSPLEERGPLVTTAATEEDARPQGGRDRTYLASLPSGSGSPEECQSDATASSLPLLGRDGREPHQRHRVVEGVSSLGVSAAAGDGDGDGDGGSALERLLRRLRSFFRELREAYRAAMVPERVPQRFTAAQRERMQRYESVDAYEPETTLFKDYLETRSHEPRWFIWWFVLALGLGTSAVAILVTNALHILQRLRFVMLCVGLRKGTAAPGDGTPWEEGVLTGQSHGFEAVVPRSPLGGYLSLILFSLGCALLASVVAAVAPESVGAGTPEVFAYFNGVDFLPLFSNTRALFAKVLLVVLTSASGVCGAGHHGPLILTGAMLGAQTLRQRRWIRCPNIYFVDCFRNPRDERVVVMIGAAAGLASALSVSVGGLVVVMEKLTTVFPTHFALYVFVACLVSCLSVQTFFSYMSGFSRRDRSAVVSTLAGLDDLGNETSSRLTALSNSSSGAVFPHPLQLFSSMAMLFHTELPFGQQVKMNVFQLVPSVFLGFLCGSLAAVYIRVCWLSLQLRRRLEVALGSGRAVRLALPIAFTLFCVSVHFALVVGVFQGGGTGGEAAAASRNGTGAPLQDGCVVLPLSVETTRNVTSIGFYGLNSFFCESAFAERNDTAVAAAAATVRPRVHGYASLAFANADAVVQSLLSVRAEQLLSAPTLAVYFILYFVLSAVYSGVGLSLDTILPPLILGGSLGRLVGLLVLWAVRTAVVQRSGDASGAAALTWADPGVFALIGAGAFLSGTSGLTFSVAAVLMEASGDFHHFLPLMIGVSIARKAAERLTHDDHAVYLAMRCVPVLHFGGRVDKLVMFNAEHVMAPVELPPPASAPGGEREPRPSSCVTAITTVRAVALVLATTTHHAFPVLSTHDGSFKGLITRWHLELLLWYISLEGGGGGGGGGRRRGRDSAADQRWGGTSAPAIAIAVTPTYEVLCRRLPNYLFHEGLRTDANSWLSLLPATITATATGSRSQPRLERVGGRRGSSVEPLSTAALERTLDLSPYLDPSALSVLHTTTLPRVYELFTTLGLRHLVVVDEDKRVVGMITRKDLVADNIMQRVRAENHRRLAQLQERQRGLHPYGGGPYRSSSGRRRGSGDDEDDDDEEEEGAGDALLLSAYPSMMSDRILIPLDPPPQQQQQRLRQGEPALHNPLASMPLHPHPAQVAASLRLRRRAEE